MPRGSKPGERRGGRKKGVPNRATVLAASVREAMMREGCDPVAVLAQVALGKKRGKNVGHMVRAASELTQYMYAKLVRAELTGPDGGHIQMDLFASSNDRVSSKLDQLAACAAATVTGEADGGRSVSAGV